MIRRALPTLAMTAVLVAAAVLTLGRPDFGLAGDFLGGRFPTTEGAVAVVALSCYLVVASVAVVAVVQAIRAASEAQATMRRSSRAAMFLITGVIVLGVAVSHRVTFQYSTCCGNSPQHIQEAAALVR
jgi:hypothetical protein